MAPNICNLRYTVKAMVT